MSVCVYWIRHKSHTDIFNQGYIGISKNIKRRWKEHHLNTENNHLKQAIKKYGWDRLIKEVILISDDKYCLEIESKLRPNDKIGWNIVKGGGKPPLAVGNKFNKGRSGNLHPMWGKKRPDTILRNKLFTHTGKNNGRYKGAIEATNIITKEIKIYYGAEDLRLSGFSPPAVYNCINPIKVHNKSHKGYTFKRLEK